MAEPRTASTRSCRKQIIPEDPMDELFEGLIGPVIGAVGVITLLLISLITG